MRRCAIGSPIPNGTYYVLGSAVGPHPYPYLVRELQAVIGREARAQMLALAGGLPDVAVACVGGGSNAIGLFHPFLGDAGVQLLGVEAGGRGPGLGDNAASLTFGTPGVLQGSYTLILQDAFGQVRETHSVSAGLDYSGVGPEHAFLMKSGRVVYESATDEEALDALTECAKCEGILPAIETAHAIFGARRYAASHPGSRILIGCSGRGDKDMSILAAHGAQGLSSRHAAARHHIRCDHGRGRAKDDRRWSGFSPPDFRPGADSARTSQRSRRPATWSRSACPSPIRWPTAPRSSARASSRSPTGVTLPWILQELDALPPPRAAPILLMSYLNPLLSFGLERCRAPPRRPVSPVSSCRTCRTRKAMS